MQFVEDCILNPKEEFVAISQAFMSSYTGVKENNRFTKVKIDLAADAALRSYFHSHRDASDGWFEVISPLKHSIEDLPDQLRYLISSEKEQ